MAVVWAIAVGSGCKMPLGSPVDIRSTMAPFERLPYVQAVDTAGARVLWLARSDATDRAEYRVGGEGTWQPARILRDTTPVFGANGELRRRSIHITDLPASTAVEYRVWADSVMAGPSTFKTAPPPGETGLVRLLAFGDSGWGSPGQVALAQGMESEIWDLAVHVGDIAYHGGSEIDFTERHFAIYRNLLGNVPFFPSVGNHDLIESDGAAYDEAFIWSAPNPGARYYSFRWGNIQFLALDTSTHGPKGTDLVTSEGAQYQWLVDTLDSASRDPTVRWIIAFFHYPMYSHAVGFSGHGSNRALRESLGPLFDRYGVDLVLSGHDHHYERTLPTRGEKIVEQGCGPVYVLTGGGGGTFFARDVERSPYLAQAARAYHYVRLVVLPDAIDLAAIGVGGEILDESFVYANEGTTPDGDPLDPRCDG
jgi:3',5'-cyclic AMP phosphodiesterase CpdA